MIARFGPVAVDEFLRGHAALALELNFDQLQRRVGVSVIVLAAADEQAHSLHCNISRSQLNRTLQRLSAVHLQRFTLKSRERPRPRLKPAQAVEEIACVASKVHAAIFFFQNRRKRGLRMTLRSRANLDLKREV